MMNTVRRSPLVLLMSLCFLAAAAAPARAVIPQYVSFQGNLHDNSGNSLNGSYDFYFEIWDREQNGTRQWFETQVGVQVTGGLYSVSLGANASLALAFDKDYWLEIYVKPSLSGSYEKLIPRQRLTSSPYSFRSEYSNNTSSATYLINNPQWTELTGGGVTGLHTHASGTPTAHIATHLRNGSDPLPAGFVSDYYIADSTITAVKLQDGAVTPSKVAAGDFEQVRAGTATIAYGMGSGEYLNDVKVSSAVYAETAGNIAAGSIGSAQITDLSVATVDVQNNAITPVKVSTGSFYHVRVGTANVSYALGSGDYLNNVRVSSAVYAENVRDGAVTSAKVAAGAYEQVRAGTATVAYSLGRNNYDLTQSTVTFYKVTISSWINPGANLTIGGNLTVNGTITCTSTQTISLGGYAVLTNVGTDYDTSDPGFGLGFAYVDLTNVKVVNLEVFYRKVSNSAQELHWQLWNETDGTMMGQEIVDSNGAGLRIGVLNMTSGIPSGGKKLRVRVYSTDATEDPVYMGSCLRLFR